MKAQPAISGWVVANRTHRNSRIKYMPKATVKPESSESKGKINIRELMNKPEYQAGVAKIPGVQLLNYAANYGLFVKPAAIKACGWVGDTVEHTGVLTDHEYNDGTVERGILFKSCHMHVLIQSHRYIEVKDVTVAPGSKRGDIIGIHTYADGSINQQGYEMYENFKAEAEANEKPNPLALRTFYLIYLLANDRKTLLHKVPFTLSVQGVAASVFGKSLESFFTSLRCDKDNPLSKNAWQVNGLAIFSPTFKATKEGKKQKSAVCTIDTYQEATPDTLDSFFDDDEEKAKRFWAIQEVGSNFARKYMEQVSNEVGVHQIAPGVDDAIPVTAKALPASTPTPGNGKAALPVANFDEIPY